MKFFTSNTLDEIYYLLLHEILKNPDNKIGTTVTDHKKDNNYKEIFGLYFKLTNIDNNKVLNKSKSIDYDYAQNFYKFMLSGKPFLPKSFIKKYPHTKKFLDSGELPKTFSAAYGPKIKRQLPKVIKLLKNNKKSRWGIINILLEQDKTVWDWKTTMEYPCCINFQFNINDKDELCMHTNMRSQNIFSILPYDVYIFTELQKLVAKKLNIALGYYSHFMASAHFFGYQENDVKDTLNIFKNNGRGINLNNEIDDIINWVLSCSKGKYNKSEIDPKPYILGNKLGIGFNIGNAVKYLSRYVSKDGEKLYNKTDLYKAIHYILLEMKRRNL